MSKRPVRHLVGGHNAFLLHAGSRRSNCSSPTLGFQVRKWKHLKQLTWPHILVELHQGCVDSRQGKIPCPVDLLDLLELVEVNLQLLHIFVLHAAAVGVRDKVPACPQVESIVLTHGAPCMRAPSFIKKKYIYIYWKI